MESKTFFTNETLALSDGMYNADKSYLLKLNPVLKITFMH